MSKVINLPSRKAQHELDRFFLAPGVIEHFPSERSITRAKRIAGWLTVVCLIAAASTLL